MLCTVGFGRKILKSFTLSDGTRLKQGTMVSAPIAMFSSDLDLLEDPETFDGFRWYKSLWKLRTGLLTIPIGLLPL